MWYFITLIGIILLLSSLIWFIVAMLRNKQKTKAAIAVVIGGTMLVSGAINVKSERAINGEIKPVLSEKEQVAAWVNKIDNSLNLTNNNNIKSFDKTLSATTSDADLYNDIKKLQSRLDNIETELQPPKFVKIEKEEEFNKAIDNLRLGLNYRTSAYDKLLDYVDSKKPSDLAAGKEYLSKSVSCIGPAVITIDKIKNDIANQYK